LGLVVTGLLSVDAPRVPRFRSHAPQLTPWGGSFREPPAPSSPTLESPCGAVFGAPRKTAMNDIRESAAQHLLEIGTLVLFRVVDTTTELSPDQENVFVRVVLAFEDDHEGTEPGDIVEAD
jgi:hypothetical protein